MIRRVQLCVSHSRKVKGSSELEFVPGYNVLTGPNGSGKSTVLRALHQCDRCRVERSDPAGLRYFNAETMNPHAPTAAAGDLRNMMLRTRGVFSSHGEILRTALISVPLQPGETLLVDEPEAGQDLVSVQRIRQGFEAICRQGVQVIAATHHPFLMRNANILELVPGYVDGLRAAFCDALCSTPKTPRTGP